MTSLHLEPWQKQKYGVFAEGFVESEKRRIPVYVRSPYEGIDDSNLPKIVNFNGIIVGAESMRVTAEVQARLGYAAITLDYSNTSDRIAPVECNAQDGLFVMDAFAAEEYRVLGLSMGGAVATLVALQSEQTITNLDIVAPGGFTDEVVGLDIALVAKAFQHESYHELYAAWRHPNTAVGVALSSLVNCCRRPNAVVAEARELLRQTMYPQLLQLRNGSPDTVVTLSHGNNDSLIPRLELLASMDRHEAEAEIPLVDLRYAYNGTHSELVYNAGLTNRILMASANVTSKMRAK